MPCDTMVTVTGDGLLFAKNSDRDANEAQLLEWVAAARHAPGSRLHCTWIDIAQMTATNAVLISRPWWMWGAEMGANEHGVVIGNEAVFTNQPDEGPGLLGMDLLRLALERSSDAAGAASVIVELLERHGQGGPCSYERPGFTYHNSFLIADPNGAIVLETAGRRWASEEVRSGGRSISNGLTIAGFAELYTDRLRERVTACRLRRARTEAAATRADGPADLMAALRDHGSGGAPHWSLANGTLRAPCVHAGGLLASSQTTASFVSDLRGPRLHWATATAAPCTSIFKPVRVDVPVELGPEPTNRFDPATLWWRHERLHRATLTDLAGLLPRYRSARDRTEAAWIREPPSSADAFATAERLEADWLNDLEGARPDSRPSWVQRSWRALDATAGRSVVA
ncbi:MAG TPA: hypothetical protein VEH29_05075 [Acidimicrobiales bacterium]|nr:hypothetical protein [Acidimicrobiales bacterium]